MLEYNFMIDPKNRLTIEQFRGELTIEAFMHYREQLYQDPRHRGDYHILTIISETFFDVSKKEIDEAIKFISRKSNQTGGVRKKAILVRTPRQTAATYLLKNSVDPNSLEIQPFSTIKAALDWLGINPKNLDQSLLKELATFD